MYCIAKEMNQITKELIFYIINSKASRLGQATILIINKIHKYKTMQLRLNLTIQKKYPLEQY